MGGRIVVGVDGSAASVAALAWAGRHAAATGGTVEVVTVWERDPYAAAPPMGAPGIPAGIPVASAEVDAAVAEEARDAALIAVTEAGLDELGVPVQLRETQGHPAPVLVEVSRDADLVVVGPSGHGAFVGMLLGSVATHLITHAHCPVVVVRGDD